MAVANGIAYSHGLVSTSCRAMMVMPHSNHVKNKVRCSSSDIERERRNQPEKRCLRCNTYYVDAHNSPAACSFHGHTTGTSLLHNTSTAVFFLFFVAFRSIHTSMFCHTHSNLWSIDVIRKGKFQI